MPMKKLALNFMILSLFFIQPALAERKIYKKADRPAESHLRFTYDLGASMGTYNGYSYSEVTLGLNYYLNSFIIWRNALFSRFGSNANSAAGLDTSIRFQFNSFSEVGDYGLTLFVGPGFRLSSEKYTGYFGEGGLVLKLQGLHIGGGVKSMIYTNPGRDANGAVLPTTDTIIFLILGGGGAF